MPRDSNGNYTLPTSPVVGNTPISSTNENTTRNDLAVALTDSLSRSGQGGMTVPFRVVDGTEAQPGVAFSSQTNTGLHRDGVDDMRADVNGRAITRWKGSDFEVRTPIVTPPPGLLADTWYKVLLVGQTIAAGVVAAVNVSVSAIADLVATNVQAALAEIVAGWGKLTRQNTWSANQTYSASIIMNMAVALTGKDNTGVPHATVETFNSDLYLGSLFHVNHVLQGATVNALAFNYGSGLKKVWHEGNLPDWRNPVKVPVNANYVVTAADDGKVLVVFTGGVTISIAYGVVFNLTIITRFSAGVVINVTAGQFFVQANGATITKTGPTTFPLGANHIVEFMTDNVVTGGTFVYGSGLEGVI